MDSRDSIDRADPVMESVQVKLFRGWDFNVAMGSIAFALIWLGVGPINLLNIIPSCAKFWNWAQFAADALVGMKI